MVLPEANISVRITTIERHEQYSLVNSRNRLAYLIAIATFGVRLSSGSNLRRSNQILAQQKSR